MTIPPPRKRRASEAASLLASQQRGRPSRPSLLDFDPSYLGEGEEGRRSSVETSSPRLTCPHPRASNAIRARATFSRLASAQTHTPQRLHPGCGRRSVRQYSTLGVDDGMRRAHEQAVTLHLPQRLRQHLLADTGTRRDNSVKRQVPWSSSSSRTSRVHLSATRPMSSLTSVSTRGIDRRVRIVSDFFGRRHAQKIQISLSGNYGTFGCLLPFGEYRDI